ncbi:MAG: hypothetical protein QOK15_2815 [Nocardioidaceae bacterium]|jgi:hypothetical protein|nr:hypothetical protein [Nocardioidaceae bacterium]
MDVDTAANIAWCLLGAVMVGMVLMYGCMHRLISEAYEEGLQDSLGRGPRMATTHGDTSLDATPTTSSHPVTTSAA